MPTVINLSSGPQEFWGDEQVYYWYRPNSVGPAPLVSALMALEVWMERHIEAEREPEELFQKVLSGSRCVAALGICLGMALAYPEKCLTAALPLVSSSAVWLMDVKRVSRDASKSFGVGHLGRHRHIYKLVAERDKRPQRSRDVRSRAMYYMFVRGESLRVSFEHAVDQFTEELPFFYQEERESPEAKAYLWEEMENFQIFGDRANYRQQQVENGVQIWVEPPEHIRARNEPFLARLNERGRWYSVNRWARKTIEEGKAAEGMTVEQGVAFAKEFQRPSDFSTPYETVDEQSNSVRLQAIAGVAAAVLLTAFEWAKEQGHIAWCREILLAAARMPSREHFMDSRHTNFLDDPRVSAGRGLGALVVHGVADAKVREQILGLVASPYLQVVEAVFRGLYDAWAVNDVLCWNALSLGLSLCLVPRKFVPLGDSPIRDAQEAKWANELLRKHVGNLKKKVIPALPRMLVGEDIIFLSDLAQRPLFALPFSLLANSPQTKEKLLQLTDDLMAWTTEENRPDLDNRRSYHTSAPYGWNGFFADWVSRLTQSLSLEEARLHVLMPIRATWPFAPWLIADLLASYIGYHMGNMEPPTADAQAAWREMCSWILASPEIVRETHYDSLSSGMADAISLIVFVRVGRSDGKDGWPHAALFREIIEKWVEVVGHHPTAYSYFLTMLDGPGWRFCPEPAVQWLTQVVEADADTRKILKKNGNGERTAELLMRMWNTYEENLRDNINTLQQYAALIDQLITVGVPLASILQQKLENL